MPAVKPPQNPCNVDRGFGVGESGTYDRTKRFRSLAKASNKTELSSTTLLGSGTGGGGGGGGGGGALLVVTKKASGPPSAPVTDADKPSRKLPEPP